jgi:hypothetical protein
MSTSSITCKSVLQGEFTRDDGIIFTATMSATGNGPNCTIAFENSTVNINKTLEDFLSSYVPEIISETHTISTTCDSDIKPIPKLTLYYRLTISPTDNNKNYSETVFAVDPPEPDIYRGIVNKYMCESDFVTYNKNIMTFNAIRTPSNESLPETIRLPALYNETISISVVPYDCNFLQAAANYLDPGSGAATTIPYVDYSVTGARGIFSEFTRVRINIYNDGDPPGYTGLGPVRIVEFF